jgi:O-antigen/teichoic acid export membrane protein
LLEGIYSRIDIFLIAKLFNVTTLGYYSRAQGFDTQIRNLTSGSLLHVLFPTFSKINQDKIQTKAIFLKYFDLISFIFSLVGGVFFLLALPIFHLVFGGKWDEAIPYFKILSLCGFAYPLSSLTLSVIEANGNSKSFFKVELIKKILALPTFYVAYKYGIIYYLISYVIFAFIATFINTFFVKYEISFSMKDVLRSLLQYYIPSILFVSLIEIFQKFFFIESYLISLVKTLCFVSLFLIYNHICKTKSYLFCKNQCQFFYDKRFKAFFASH